MKLKTILTSAVLLASFTSCLSTEEVFSIDSENGLVELTFTVSSSDTKASMGGSFTTQWEEGDEFSVYDPITGDNRKFTAVTVEGGNAKISGTISDGVFPLSVVYPYNAVKSWKSQDECEIEYPSDQMVPDSANVDPKALVCACYSAEASDYIRLKGLCPLVSFSIAKADVDEVVISLTAAKGGEAENYVIRPEKGVFAEGLYYALVKPGSYAGGVGMKCRTEFDVEYGKTSDKTLELAAGECISLGCATDGKKRFPYESYGEFEIANLEEFAQKTGYYDGLGYVTKSAFKMILNLYFREYASDAMYTTNISYTSADINGNPVTLSARVFIPKPAITKGRKLDGVVMSSRHTTTKASFCPTSDPFISECLLAWKNCALVMCDLHGFGTDIDSPQAFVNGDLCARAAIDGLEATLQLLDDRGIKYNDRIFNFGYSQGGLIAVANQKFVCNHPERDLKIYKTFAGGGAYDFELCFDKYVSEPWEGTTRFVILSIISINESEKLGLDYTKIFQEPLLSNYKAWILDKKYSISQIMNLVGTDVLSEVLVPEFMAKNTAEYRAIVEKAATYNLTQGWNVPAGSTLYLFHSKEDDYIPYGNFTELKAALGSPSNVKYHDGNHGGHQDAILPFVIWVLSNW